MTHSYPEQSKRHLTYLAENGHKQINDKSNEVLIHGKIYNLINLIDHMVTNRKKLESYDSHLHKFLKSSNFQEVLLRKNSF